MLYIDDTVQYNVSLFILNFTNKARSAMCEGIRQRSRMRNRLQARQECVVSKWLCSWHIDFLLVNLSVAVSVFQLYLILTDAHIRRGENPFRRVLMSLGV